MIVIEEKKFAQHHLLEVVDAELKTEALPLVIFYHGWTDHKDHGIAMAAQLAKKGIRTVIPDQLFHGERSSGSLTGLELWEIIAENLKEFPEIVSYYQSQQLADSNHVAVAGYSMGGMTVYALLKQYAWIKAGASLMGNPDPVQFAQWAMNSVWMKGKQPPKNVSQLVEQFLPTLERLSLVADPKTIANRPLLIWHGMEDDKVPYAMNKSFYDHIKDEDYAQQVVWLESPGVKHMIPFPIIEKTTQFLADKLMKQ